MDVTKHVEKAAEALRKRNFDYAISLYHQVLQLKPDHGEARRELREALVRRAEYKKVPPVIALLQGLPSRIGMLLGALTKNRGQVVMAAESYLRNDPRNRRVNWALASALEAAGHRNSAVAVWEFLGEDEQVGDEALKRAGAIYYQLQQMEKALGCYETVLKRSPRDSEAEKMRKNLAAEGVLSSGSYDPTRSSRDLARDQQKLKELEAEQKIVTTEDERELLRRRLADALAEDPADKRARRALVDHHVKAKEFARAAEVLEEGLAAEPDSYELRERLGDVRILAYEQQLRELKAKADAGDEAARTDLVDVSREKRDFEIEEFTRRVKDHPTDLELRFRLGRLLLEGGEVDRAIENLQHAVKDPRRRVESLLGLGRAFESKGMLDLAAKQLSSALEGVDKGSDRATDIAYALGVLSEKTGDLEAAKARFESIYERDIHYEDVAERLERLSAQGAKGAASAGADASPAPEQAPEPEPERTPPPRREESKQTDESRTGDAGGGSLYDFKD